MSEPIRVLLADDHTLVRAGIRALLQNVSGVTVVGEAEDGFAVLRQIQTTQPHVVLMDIAMPGLNGLEALPRIAKEFPAVRVIILSMYANEAYVRQALRSGAAGYLLKGARLIELELAIIAVASGQTYLSPTVSHQFVGEQPQRLPRPGVRQAAVPNTAEMLTPRQREVLQLLASGQSTKEMARTLGLSTKTVEMYRSQLMKRLGIHDVPGLVRYAIQSGLVNLD